MHKRDRDRELPPLIDVHCHLAAAEFDHDRGVVIDRARAVGVQAAIVVGECYEDNLRVLELAAAEPFVLPALGHHPWQLERAKADVPRTLALIDQHAAELAAVGEVGLDYRTATSPADRGEQRAVLRELVAAAQRHQLPLSVHVRSAGHYVLDELRAAGCPPPGVALHAFDGKAKYARAGGADGFHFSVPGTVLVSSQKQKLARALPLDRLLLESDAPALSPVRGERNEPAVIAQVLAAVAELRGEPIVELAAATTANARRLFRLDGRGRLARSVYGHDGAAASVDPLDVDS